MATKSTRSHRTAPSPPWTEGLARAVRTQRRQLGLTQQELSRMAGCGPVFIYDVERGQKATLQLDKLVEVLRVLGLELVLELGHDGLRVSERLR